MNRYVMEDPAINKIMAEEKQIHKDMDNWMNEWMDR